MAERKKIYVSIGDKDYLSGAEVKAYLSIGDESLRKMMEEGLERYNPVGRRIFFKKEDIKNFIDRHRV